MAEQEGVKPGEQGWVRDLGLVFSTRTAVAPLGSRRADLTPRQLALAGSRLMDRSTDTS